MKKIVLVSGRMSGGKNQFSEYLKEAFESKKLKVEMDLFAKEVKEWSSIDFKHLSTTLHSLADSMLKEMVQMKGMFESYGIAFQSGQMISKIKELYIHKENWFEDKTPITRSLLQVYGTEIFRKRVDNNFWVNRAKERFIKSNADVIIVTDCRFQNEIDSICSPLDFDLIPVRINRPQNHHNHLNEHVSETALDDYKNFSYTIENDKGLEELKQSAYAMVDDIDENDCHLEDGWNVSDYVEEFVCPRCGVKNVTINDKSYLKCWGCQTGWYTGALDKNFTENVND